MLISHQERNIERIAALDDGAAHLKLTVGMGIADARAMYPAIEIVTADVDADRKILETLADWCDRYTPLVTLDGTNGMFLDITGCAHFFSGEEIMLESMLARFLEQGFAVRAGLASTPSAAWAAARFSQETAILKKDGELRFLQSLPLAALRIEPGVIASLESVGLRTVGMIHNAPRAPLARRFGKELLVRLDQALGKIDEPISPRLPVPAFAVERHFAEPIELMNHIEGLTFQLASDLRTDLDKRGQGARRFDLLLFRVDGVVTRVSARSSLPLRDPVSISKLFQERFVALSAVLEPGYGFDLIRLAAFETASTKPLQTDLQSRSQVSGEDVALFTDRVRARFGPNAILSPLLVESHLPEQASLLVPKLHQATGSTAPDALASRYTFERPLRLFSKPEPIDVPATEIPEGPPLSFRWRRSMHRVTRAEGPERISPEWWVRNAPRIKHDAGSNLQKRKEAEQKAIAAEVARLTRDYFRVEDAEGKRFWLFRKGLYGGQTQPRWFIQGLFA